MEKVKHLSAADVMNVSGTNYTNDIYDVDGVTIGQVRRVSSNNEATYHYALREDPTHPWEIYCNGCFKTSYNASWKAAEVAEKLESLDTAANLTHTSV